MLSAALLLSLTSVAAPTQDFGDYHALVIGNNKYQNHPELETAVKDAKVIASLLEKDYEYKVKLLVDATSAQIEDALFELRRIPTSDNILIYYAGHGFLDETTDQGYWFGIDATERPRTWVSNADIRTEVKGIRAKHVLILSDSCFSGSLTRGLNVEGLEPAIPASQLRALKRLSDKKTRLVISSGGKEPVTDRGEGGHSVFAYKLIELLKDNDSITTGQALFAPLSSYVSLNASQDPTLGRMREVSDSNDGDFLFVRKRGGLEAPPPSMGPRRHIQGTIEQPRHQATRIRVEGHTGYDKITGSGIFVIPVETNATSLILVAEVDGKERERREVSLGKPSRVDTVAGDMVKVHEIGTWVIASRPIYIEGRLTLPPSAASATLQVRPDLSRVEGFDPDFHEIDRSQGTGAFTLILPDTSGQIELVVTAEGMEERSYPLYLRNAERKLRKGRPVGVLDVGELRIDKPGREISLAVLSDRGSYSRLEKAQVLDLALAAQQRWAEQLDAFKLEGVERFSSGGKSHWMSIWLHYKSGLEFILVPGGTFQMGSPSVEPDREADEPQHELTLSPFLIARTECTQGAWSKLMRGTPSYFRGSDRLPVESVSATQAGSWCKQAGLQLPTEAQWEFACRAGTTGSWNMGGSRAELRRHANLWSAECPDGWDDDSRGMHAESWNDGYGDQTARVGSFEPNAFGLFDMHGNVWEWCDDDLAPYGDPAEPGTGYRRGERGTRMMRGGAFSNMAKHSRSAFRSYQPESKSGSSVGFRPALDLPQ